MKYHLVILFSFLFIIFGCAKKDSFHMEYEFYDPEEPSLNVYFPQKTYLVSAKTKENGPMNCKSFEIRTKRPNEFNIKIKKCILEVPYNWASRHIARLKSKLFLVNKENKSIGISMSSSAKGIMLKSDIYYFVDTQNIIEITVTKDYSSMSNSIMNKADWIKKNPEVFKEFKSFSLYIYNEIVVNKNL